MQRYKPFRFGDMSVIYLTAGHCRGCLPEETGFLVLPLIIIIQKYPKKDYLNTLNLLVSWQLLFQDINLRTFAHKKWI